MKKLLLTTAAILALGACATGAPTYRAATQDNISGYSGNQRADGRYVVTYTGSKSTTREQVAELALLRAAEMTVESGDEWFAVIDSGTERIALVSQTDLTDKGALDSGGADTSTGAQPSDNDMGSDVDVNMGPSTGGFGGGGVPYQALERWQPPKGYQTTLVIQMGSGDEAEFPGVTEQPQLFPAQQTADEIRAELGLTE